MAQMQWTQATWLQTQPVIERIMAQPFIQELMQGTLAREKFFHYIEQDALYLKQFARSLANILPKLENIDQTQAFLGFMQDTAEVENALHKQFLNQGDSKNLQPTATNLLYTQFMLATTSMNNAAIGIAAVLPCFWIYKHVGDYIYAHYEKTQNPYFEWIQTYAGEEFGQAVAKAIQIADELASTQSLYVQQQMTNCFITASKMEYLFWDSAYELEQWKI